MKRHASLLFAALVTCALFSCGHKDDNAKPTQEIIGGWDGTQLVSIEYQGSQLIGSDTALIVSPDYLTLEFKTGNSFAINSSINGSENHQSGYYQLQGNMILLGGTVSDPNKETYTYQLNGKSLVLHYTSNDTVNNVIYRDEEQIWLQKH